MALPISNEQIRTNFIVATGFGPMPMGGPWKIVSKTDEEIVVEWESFVYNDDGTLLREPDVERDSNGNVVADRGLGRVARRKMRTTIRHEVVE